MGAAWEQHGMSELLSSVGDTVPCWIYKQSSRSKKAPQRMTNIYVKFFAAFLKR
jgi:hypothetical protein